MAKPNIVLKGAALLLAATVLWGGMFPVAKDALLVVDAYYLNVLRYGITAAAFLGLLLLVEGRQALRFDGKFIPACLFGAIGFAGFSLLAFVGLSHSTAVHGAIIMAMQPMIGALVRWLWLGQRPARITFACIALAFAGVFLVVTRARLGNLFSGAGWGDLLILLGAVSWVIYTLGAARFALWSPLRYTALTCLTGEAAIVAVTCAATALGVASPPGLHSLTPVAPQLVYLVLFASIIAVLAWNVGIRCLDPLNGILFINVVPVTAFLIGIYQGQHFVAAELIGAALVIAALFANNLALKLPARAAAHPAT